MAGSVSSQLGQYANSPGHKSLLLRRTRHFLS